MISILFVCLGNICRSPLAQGIFEEKIKELGIADHFKVDSAGTSGWHEGELPDPGSREIAERNGFSIDHQRSRRVRMSDKDDFDYLIAMDSSNAQALMRDYAVQREKVILMREFDHEEDSKDVPDPYGFRGDAFARVYQILERSINEFIIFLKDKHPEIN